jgi:hypothetical protein
VTAKSPKDLDAEYQANGHAYQWLRAQPERTRRQYDGMTFGAIRRDRRYLAARAVAHTVQRPAPRTPRQSGRRHLEARETSSADPGDADGDPEPPRPRRSIYHAAAGPERVALDWLTTGAGILAQEGGA